MSHEEAIRAIAENAVRGLFPAIEGQMVDCIVVLATTIDPDSDGHVLTWFDGSATTALGLSQMLQANILMELRDSG